MSDTAVNDPSATPMLLPDGDAPRLGTGPFPAPTPQTTPLVGAPLLAPASGAPLLPPATPVLPSSGTPAPLNLSPAGIGEAVLPPPATAAPTSCETPTKSDAQPEHPMAHLMPSKSKPTEASRRAAEARAAKKAKAKKIKIAVAAGVLVVTALVGPPLFRWLSNAVNEAGNTSTEQPAD